MTSRSMVAIAILAVALSFVFTSTAGTQVAPQTPSIGNIPSVNVVGGGFKASLATNSDGTPSVTSGTPTVCTVSTADNLTVSYIGAGMCTLTAHTAASSNFDAADGNPQDITVGQATLTLDTTPNAGSGVAGATVSDGANLAGQAAGIPASNAVIYTLDAGTCAAVGSEVGADSATVMLNADGSVPGSGNFGPLAAGSYVFEVTYSGDANYKAITTPQCEAFSVTKATPSVATVVYDASTNTPWAGNEVAGGSSYDTSAVTGTVAGFAATGTVTYTFFPNGTCTGPGTALPAVTLSGGAVPQSETSPPLAAQEYSYAAVYSGDANYTISASSTCELFGLGKKVPTTPFISNLPSSPIAEGGFTASVSSDGDGQPSVTSATPRVCSVGGDGLTVTYLAPGLCTLTSQLAVGHNYFGATGDPQTFVIRPIPHGYWLVGSDGGIFTFGNSQFWGSTGNVHLQRPVVGIAPTGSRNGYWLVASDGGIFSFGDSGFYGSIPGVGLHPAGSGASPSLNAPIVAMVPSATGHGYFMVASDGGVFAFGDARFVGSCPGIGGCSGPAVAVVPDATGNGYWLFTNTGNVYTFGDAPYYGASPATGVAVTSAVATPDGHGYWILFANGAVAPFGDAPGLGSPIGYTNSSNPATTIFPTANGGGYWVGSARGDVFAYGDAPFLGSMAATPLNGLIVAASGY